MRYVWKLAAIATITIPAALATIIIGLFDPNGRRVYGISRLWTALILRVAGISLAVQGLNQLDPNQQYVFMANHQSNFDIPVLVQSLAPFQLRWIAKRELLWIPLFGWAMWAAKHLTVDRSDRSEGVGIIKQARRRMAAGISVVVFPEGTRSTDGRLLPFKRGGFLLAVKTKKPIVPVTINGSGRILPKGAWTVRSGKIHVTVGKPITVDKYRPGTLKTLSAALSETIAHNLATTEPDSDTSAKRSGPAAAREPARIA